MQKLGPVYFVLKVPVNKSKFLWLASLEIELQLWQVGQIISQVTKTILKGSAITNSLLVSFTDCIFVQTRNVDAKKVFILPKLRLICLLFNKFLIVEWHTVQDCS